MIKYIKNQIKNIPMIVLICILFYSIVTIATSNINSNDITFDNTNSNLNAGDMQEAIDEVFQHATDYNEIKTTIGDSTLTTTNKTLTGAVNELNDKSIISPVRLTTNASGIQVANDYSLRMGDVVFVSLFIRASASKPAWTVIANVPDDCKPKNHEVQAMVGATSCYINNDGTIVLRGALPAGDHSLNVVYYIYN